MDHAQNNAKAIPGLRYPEFNGSDMSSLPEWASHFFNAINLFKPVEEHACQTALCLTKESASVDGSTSHYHSAKRFQTSHGYD